MSRNLDPRAIVDAMHQIRALLSNATGIHYATQEQLHALLDYCALMDEAADAVRRDDDATYKVKMSRLFDDTLTIGNGLEDGSIELASVGGGHE